MWANRGEKYAGEATRLIRDSKKIKFTGQKNLKTFSIWMNTLKNRKMQINFDISYSS